MQTRTLVAVVALTIGTARADRPLAPFIAVDAPVTALTHVTVIDGTGPAAQAKVPKEAKVLLASRTARTGRRPPDR